MGESLYAILGVTRSADADTIRQAYRDNAKTHHPDVSDAPDARRQFKRLTVARDTLLDEDERARYEELGHESYVRQHGQSELFEVGSGSDDGVGATGGSTGKQTVTDGYGDPGEWWQHRDGTEPGSSRSSNGTRRQPRQSEPAVEWARSRDRVGTASGTAARPSGLRRVVDECGVWLLFHLFLLASALSTGWFVYTTGAAAGVAFPALVIVVLVVSLTSAGSTLHLVWLVYT